MSAELNPYAPPRSIALEQGKQAEASTPWSSHPNAIKFSGRAGDAVLHDYLLTDGFVGPVFGIILLILALVIIPTLTPLGVGTVLVATSVFGVLGIGWIASTVAYRRACFVLANPHWNDPVVGQLDDAGIRLKRDDATVFLRWDWFGDAVLRDDWVAWIPVTRPQEPWLLSRAMLESDDDWRHVLEIAGELHRNAPTRMNGSAATQLSALVRDPNRPRTIPVPAEPSSDDPSAAIAIQGIIRVDDYERLPASLRRRGRPIRSVIVVSGLFICGGMLIIGVSQWVFDQWFVVPAVVIGYLALVAMTLTWRRRTARANPQVVLFFNGFADPNGLVSDFAAFTIQIPWSQLQLVMQTDDMIALRRRRWWQFLIIRRDMLEAPDQWPRLCHWIEPLQMPVESSSQ